MRQSIGVVRGERGEERREKHREIRLPAVHPPLCWWQTEDPHCPFQPSLKPPDRLARALAYEGYHNKTPQTGWLTQQTLIFSQFWSPEVQDQCVSRVGFY